MRNDLQRETGVFICLPADLSAKKSDPGRIAFHLFPHASGISGSTSFANFSSDSCQPR